jgi:hypothetical protein
MQNYPDSLFDFETLELYKKSLDYIDFIYVKPFRKELTSRPPEKNIAEELACFLPYDVQ